VTLDEVQGAYDEALRRVLRDLPADLVDATVTVDFTSPDDSHYQFSRPDGTGHSRSLAFTDDVELATVTVADQVQEDVFETVWSASWPECRWHDHAAVPRLIDGHAFWVCPRSGFKAARIGETNEVTPRRRRNNR
jgi:hypothetical protein